MGARGHEGLNSSGKRDTSPADRAISGIAARSEGRITTAQLRDLGLSQNQIDYRARVGRLHRVARGVYAVGHLCESRRARWLTAVLRVGPEAVLSDRAAAAHWQLRAYAGAIDVSYPRRHRPVAGIRLHRRRLPADEVTIHEGIPVTTVPRTLFDLAAILSPGRLELAIGEAEKRGLTDALSLPDLLDRYPGRRGAATIRTVVARSAAASA